MLASEFWRPYETCSELEQPQDEEKVPTAIRADVLSQLD